MTKVNRRQGKDLEEARPEIVYCKAKKCQHNLGRGKCDIVHTVNSDDKIGLNANGLCEDYFVA